MSHKWRVWLLADALIEPIPFPIFILTCLVKKNKVNAPQCRGWRPLHFGVCTRSLVVQDSLDGINTYVLDTHSLRQTGLEVVHLESSGAYDLHPHVRTRPDGSLKQHCRLATARVAGDKQKTSTRYPILFIFE